MARRPAAPARRAGRPPAAAAGQLRERILDAATVLFLAEGYGATSIEAVAARAGVSKRTFYDRFDDKAMLFTAVVHRIIERIRPPADVPLIAGANLAEKLDHLAHLILQAALATPALALHRLVTAESARFPELARAVDADAATAEALALIGDLVARELPDIRLTAPVRRFLAEQFIFMVMTVPQRRALGYGTPMTEAELDAWARRVVRLFLQGCGGLKA